MKFLTVTVLVMATALALATAIPEPRKHKLKKHLKRVQEGSAESGSGEDKFLGFFSSEETTTPEPTTVGFFDGIIDGVQDAVEDVQDWITGGDSSAEDTTSEETTTDGGMFDWLPGRAEQN